MKKNFFSKFLSLAIASAAIAGILAVAHSLGWGKPNDGSTSIVDAESAMRASKSLDIAVGRGRVDIAGGVIQLAASRDGVISEVLVEEGESTTKGQILATLDSRRAALDLRLAQKELDQLSNRIAIQQLRLQAAEREETRLSRLALQGAVSTAKLDQAKDEAQLLDKELANSQAMLSAQKVRVELARLDVEHMSIRAPTDGVVIRRNINPGEGVSTQNVTPLFWFAPDTQYIIRADLEERFIHTVKPGMWAEVYFEGTPAPIKAKVIRLGKLFGPKRNPAEDPGERNDVRVLEFLLEPVDANANLVLGQRVLVRIKG